LVNELRWLAVSFILRALPNITPKDERGLQLIAVICEWIKEGL
jgi:hypothetical protein